MTNAEAVDYYPFLEPERVRRSVHVLSPPPLIGWRRSSIGKHRIQNQLIKRSSRRDFGVWESEEVETRDQVVAHAPRRVVRQLEDDTRKLFRTLAKSWQSDTAFLSSVSSIALHPAYQRIIGMGPVVLPLILRDLQKAPSHWFWALNAITGENPIPEDANGDISRMQSSWLDWGKKRGLLVE